MLRSHSVNSFDTDEDMANMEDNIYETLVSNGAAWGSVGWHGVA